MHCPSCGEEVSDSAHFCPVCGAGLGRNALREAPVGDAPVRSQNFAPPVQAPRSRGGGCLKAACAIVGLFLVCVVAVGVLGGVFLGARVCGALTSALSGASGCSLGSITSSSKKAAAGVAYVAALQKEVQEVAAADTALTSLSASPQLSDPTWRSQFMRQVTVYGQVYGEAQKLSPPPCLADTHQAWLSALQQMTQAAQKANAGLAANDTAMISQAVGQIESSAGVMGDATSTLQQVDLASCVR